MEKIQFKNRNGDDITFEKVGDNTYKFYSSFNYGMRMGYKDDAMKEISFVDPSGGPFVSIGYIIPEINEEVIEILLENDEILIKTRK